METKSFPYEVIYFLGIGGIGMSALARYFHKNNYIVMGYDKTPTGLTTALELEGIVVHFDDTVMAIPQLLHSTPKEKILIVRTPAVPKDSKQFEYFQREEYTILKRSEVLGLITEMSKTIAVGGTHGKTTTSTLVAHLFNEQTGCNAFLGGISSNFHSNLLLSDSDWTVVEADEFDRSFLTLSPAISVLTSMDADHLDIYGDEAHIREGFLLFLDRTVPSGHVVVKRELAIHDELKRGGKSVYTYSILGEADFEGRNIRVENGAYVYDVHTPFGDLTKVQLGLPGRHNVENAIAAIASVLLAGLELGKLAEALHSFRGVQRRFDVRFKSESQVYIDDYAHHPTELHSCFASARELYPGKKITAIFQPHLFSRTRDFAEGFAASLSEVDELILLPIYPARELPIPGIDSQWLFDKIQLSNKHLVNKEAIFTFLNRDAIEVLITVGAGDIDTLVSPIQQWFQDK